MIDDEDEVFGDESSNTELSRNGYFSNSACVDNTLSSSLCFTWSAILIISVTCSLQFFSRYVFVVRKKVHKYHYKKGTRENL